MSFTSEQLQVRMSALASGKRPTRWVLAFSGGLDSTVLLHALKHIGGEIAVPLVAIHVQHDLHADANNWEAHCRAAASALECDYDSIPVAVDRASGLGLEASARAARYQALRKFMQPGDWLLSAHHQDDQAETLLLSLLRGSGMAGMAGIGVMQEFAPGSLVRPLLDVSRPDLQAYAAAHSLAWLDDPSNADTGFDRNYLRHIVLPKLAERWPAASARLARSAELAGEASSLLDQLADDDLFLLGQPQRLNIAVLAEFTDARQRNVLRRALKRCGLGRAPATRLRQVIDELVPARVDAEPLVRWPGAEVRRYREFIYLLPAVADLSPQPGQKLGAGKRSLELGKLGRMSLQEGSATGIRADIIERGLEVRFRAGGEEIRPAEHECTHKLKKLLQQKGIVPWMRDKIPLLYCGDRLVAVADLWVAADDADQSGSCVRWEGHPAIY
jgi:tRNA(Ile)-lysidine synthase